MTNHGFGIAHYSKIDPKVIAEIAGRISEVQGVVWTHVVKKHEVADYSIIFEFGHPRKYDRTLGDLLSQIHDITRATSIDIYIIQSSYKG